jgi:2'-5' RNA ligase
VRCFLAIELPEDVRRHLARVQGALRDPPDDVGSVSWVRRENWHVTLKFLGERADAEVVRVCEALRGVVAGEPMTLCPERMVYFPRRGPLRVIAVDVGGDVGRLSALYGRIDEACAAAGIERDARAFRGHITLGRARHGGRGGGFMSVRSRTLPELLPGPRFDTLEFALFQSELHPQGSRYTKLATFPLRDG